MKHVVAGAALGAIAILADLPFAHAQNQPAVFGPAETTRLTTFYRPYIRLGIGAEQTALDDENWLPPGDSDPEVFFDLDDASGAMGSLALGRDWGRGVRAEIALLGFGKKDFEGDWSYTIPETPGPHASVEAQVSSGALMANVYYSPFEAQGNTGQFQPFAMAGIGVSRNAMDDWTRINPDAGQERRTFEGASKTDLAWTVGVGAAWQISARGQKPVMLELLYQYVDLGRAEGGNQPLPGSGTSEPRRGLGFDVSSQVVSIGVRIPFD